MQLLLAQQWLGQSPGGWWMSEKLDGVRAYWTGEKFLTRNGNELIAPCSLTLGLPPDALDGELWSGRGRFDELAGIVRRKSGDWPGVQFCVFDAPDVPGGFESRQAWLTAIPSLTVVQQTLCTGENHMLAELERIVDGGGEGLMLRMPGSAYERRRSPVLLKVKRFCDAEGVVVGYEPGRGKHAGKTGALLVLAANGKRILLGTGLTDLAREHPPVIGAVVTYKYQELTAGGMPRFPVYLRVAG